MRVAHNLSVELFSVRINLGHECRVKLINCFGQFTL